MKISCEVINDLLPLYVDESCSNETVDLIEEHLADCEKCSQICDNMRNILVPEENTNQGVEQEEAYTAKEAIKKVKRRWKKSLIAVFLITLLIVPGIYLGMNEKNGAGIGFSNIDDIYHVKYYIKQLEKGNYKKAFAQLNVKEVYKDLTTIEEYKIEQTYELITIGDQEYYVASRKLIDSLKSHKDSLVQWKDVYDRKAPLIPLEEYKKLKEKYLNEIADLDKNGTYGMYTIGEEQYCMLNTLWLGKKPIANNYASVSELDDSFWLSMAQSQEFIIPKDKLQMVLDAYQEFSQEERERKAPYTKMTYKEYYQQVEERFVHNMEQLKEKGITITGCKFRESTRIGKGREQIKFYVYLSMGGKEFKKLGMILHSEGRKLEAGGSFTQGPEEDKADILFDMNSILSNMNAISD